MTEKELDHIIRRVLVDSLKAETELFEEDQNPSFSGSSRHKRQMRAMLANPIRWLNRRKYPAWRRIAQRAAIILLACILIFGGVMAFSPTAQAVVVRWAMKWYGNNIEYQYTGELNTEVLPQYEIAGLPEGYVETVRDTAPGLVAVTYENQEGDVIYFVYNYTFDGAFTFFDVEDDEVFDVMVHQINGYFFQSSISGDLNSVTWIDEDKNIHFTLDGNFGMTELLHIAESVSLCKVTK